MAEIQHLYVTDVNTSGKEFVDKVLKFGGKVEWYYHKVGTVKVTFLNEKQYLLYLLSL